MPDKIWLESYPAWAPASIEAELDTIPSLTAELLRITGTYAARPAFTSMGSTLSYAAWEARARAFAAWLRAEGVQPGERVAIMQPNCLQYPVCLLGALMAGAIVVNCNPLYTAPELRHQLTDSGATVLVVFVSFAHVAAAARLGTALRRVVITGIGDLMPTPRGQVINLLAKASARPQAHGMADAIPLRRALAAGSRVAAAFVVHPARHEDIAFLQYTGGTTGVAKGAMLTHRNLLANLVQARVWAGPSALRRLHVVATLLPMYHVFALTVNCMLFMSFGVRNILIANPRDMKRTVAQLAREPIDALTGVNALFHALASNPEFRRRDFSRLRLCFAGGTAVHSSVAARWYEVTGCHLAEGYGLTETSPIVTCNIQDMDNVESMRWNGSIGLPLPSTELRFIDTDGQEVPQGSPGELCVRGPQVMAGYWQRPDETARVLDKQGWLRTGDVGVMDPAGRVRLVDRIKDMLLVSGFNVYPTEIEDVASRFAGVREAAVIGVPDPVMGERVKLIVVTDGPIDTEALLLHCRTQLTPYKVPRIVEVRTEPLPKTPVGKVLRRALR